MSFVDQLNGDSESKKAHVLRQLMQVHLDYYGPPNYGARDHRPEDKVGPTYLELLRSAPVERAEAVHNALNTMVLAHLNEGPMKQANARHALAKQLRLAIPGTPYTDKYFSAADMLANATKSIVAVMRESEGVSR